MDARIERIQMFLDLKARGHAVCAGTRGFLMTGRKCRRSSATQAEPCATNDQETYPCPRAVAQRFSPLHQTCSVALSHTL